MTDAQPSEREDHIASVKALQADDEWRLQNGSRKGAAGPNLDFAATLSKNFFGGIRRAVALIAPHTDS